MKMGCSHRARGSSFPLQEPAVDSVRHLSIDRTFDVMKAIGCHGLTPFSPLWEHRVGLITSGLAPTPTATNLKRAEGRANADAVE